MTLRLIALTAGLSLSTLMLACSSDNGGNSGNGGSPGQGGSASGGAASGGAASGGAASGGAASGGAASGGAASGGAASGGAASGGASSGGKANGGSSNGGSNNGGSSNGGSNNGGVGGGSAGQNSGGRAGGGGQAGGGNTAGAAGGGSTATFAQVAMILSMKCAGSTCHGGSGANAQVNLVDMNGLYTRLTTALPMSTPHCKGSTLVTANDANSLLVKVVSGPTMCTNGTAMESLAKMPDNCSGNSCLTPAQIKTITDWIAAGAPM